MRRRLLVRLTIAATAAVVSAVAALTIVILLTSAPESLPLPLPTATARPGPESTSTLPRLPISVRPSALLPTATPQPGPPHSLAIKMPKPLMDVDAVRVPNISASASPNLQVQLLMSSENGNAAALSSLAYEDTSHPDATDRPCTARGRWSVDVNPQSVVGHPYSAAPTNANWAQAAQAIKLTYEVCPVAIYVGWFAHDAKHPASDRWVAPLPASDAVAIDGRTLQRYAHAHARQV